MRYLLILMVGLGLGVEQGTSTGCYPITAADLRDAGAPTYEQFSVPRKTVKSVAPLDLESHPIARRYGSVLRAGIRKGPNFASHHRIVAWSCGSSCTQFAVIDLLSGKVFAPSEFDYVTGVQISTSEFQPETMVDGWALRYRADSRLLVVLGALDENADRQGATFYAFDRGSFQRLHTTYVRKQQCISFV